MRPYNRREAHNHRVHRIKESYHRVKRSRNQYRAIKLAKLRDPVINNPTKSILRCSFLNVNGLTEATLNNVETVCDSKKPDIVFLLETKRREEDTCIDI